MVIYEAVVIGDAAKYRIKPDLVGVTIPIIKPGKIVYIILIRLIPTRSDPN